MGSRHVHRFHRSPYLCLFLLVGLSACQTIPTKTYEVRQRAFAYQPSSLVRDYQEEYAYIQERRETAANRQANGASDRPPHRYDRPGQSHRPSPFSAVKKFETSSYRTLA
jgi:hypothetical protein